MFDLEYHNNLIKMMAKLDEIEELAKTAGMCIEKHNGCSKTQLDAKNDAIRLENLRYVEELWKTAGLFHYICWYRSYYSKYDKYAEKLQRRFKP